MASRQEIIAQVLMSVDGVAPGTGTPLPKHVKMASTPFSFMRGSAALFYRDPASDGWSRFPLSLRRGIPLTTIQGDCHMANFGFTQDLPLCHIVEVKQQRRAAPLGFFDDLSPTNRLNPAHLTVVCQRRMQRQPDLVLDQTLWQGAPWLIRSRHHAKVGIAPEALLTAESATEAGLLQYAQACGRALALAHSRGDRRSSRYEQAVCGTLPQHAEALLDAAASCAEQTQRDWVLLTDMLAG